MADSRYSTVKTMVSETQKKYLANTLYPDVPVSEDDWYVITTAGDRFDLLSQQFYSTMEFWWVIAIANNLSVDTLCPEPGLQIRIPVNPVEYTRLVEDENK